MWIFTDKGFISAVAYDEAKDYGAKMSHRARRRLGRNPIMARARVKADLEQIRPFYAKLNITDEKSADYRFRAIVPRKAWVAWVSAKAEGIDYNSHFKDVACQRSTEGAGRHTAYYGVWTAMSKLQPTAPYSGAGLYAGGGSLCDARVVLKTTTADNTVVYGSWCNYKKDHSGKHDFEVKAAPGTKVEWKYDKGTGAAFTGSSWGGSAAAKVQTTGCAIHSAHKFEGGQWRGLGKTTNTWFDCSWYKPSYAQCIATHGSQGRCKLDAGHSGAHSWTHLSLDDSTPDERAAGVADHDSVLGMMRALESNLIGEVELDEHTPAAAWELWAYCEQAWGETAQLTEEEVAQAVVDCVDDEVLVDARDEFLSALDEYGYRVVDNDAVPLGEENLANGVPSATGVEDVPDSNSAVRTETAVAVVEGGLSDD